MRFTGTIQVTFEIEERAGGDAEIEARIHLDDIASQVADLPCVSDASPTFDIWPAAD